MNNENNNNKLATFLREVSSWIITLIIAFVIARMLTNYVIVNAKIPTGSMENTVMTGDMLIANRLAYNNSDPKRGDIVVFKYPVDENQLYIKRIIGLPNEKIEIIDGKIYINDSSEPLEESYLPEEWVVKNDGYVFNVPDECYLMMGDNRNYSSDARDWASEAIKEGVVTTEEDSLKYHYVKRDKIVGKAMFRYWPIADFKTF